MKIMIHCPDDVNYHDLKDALLRLMLTTNENRIRAGEKVLITFDDSEDRQRHVTGPIQTVVRKDDVDDAAIEADLGKLERLMKPKPKPRRKRDSGVI